MNDAIEASSSTTSTVWGLPTLSACLARDGRRDVLRAHKGQRVPVAAVERVPAVAAGRVRVSGEPDLPLVAAGEQVDAGAPDHDAVGSVDGAEAEVRPTPLRSRLLLP